MMQVFDLVDMLAPFLPYLLQAVQVLINVHIRGPMVDFQIVPQLAVDLAISLTLGQNILQSLGQDIPPSLGDEVILLSKNNGRVDRG
jgi:hypothetical protein